MSEPFCAYCSPYEFRDAPPGHVLPLCSAHRTICEPWNMAPFHLPPGFLVSWKRGVMVNG